jgi:FixJ family two-component response regulator
VRLWPGCCARRLLAQGHDSAAAFEQALGAAEPSTPGCILLDVRMPVTSGLTLFERLLARGVPELWPVIFLTGHADVPTAVDTVKRGAFDFARSPFPTTRWSTASSRRWPCRASVWRSVQPDRRCRRASAS